MDRRRWPREAQEKALAVNLNERLYGTFAEIGAGQEVVRWFFRAGGAAGTIAKSISAYDMGVSDAIYGDCERYVCRERLEAMLRYEQGLNMERLMPERGDRTAFFTFADTVSAQNFHGTNDCHGWMGIRFQAHPRDVDSQITLHVRMLDPDNRSQQEALGIVGVNLIYGACFLSHEPEHLVESLLDGLTTERIEIDMIEFSGIEFRHVDNRVMALQMVKLGLTGAAMLASDGFVVQPSDVLRKRPIVVQRGRFRPLTHVNMDMLQCALAHFEREHAIPAGEALPVMEITMNSLREGGGVDLQDFVARAEVLSATGYHVMISEYFEYYRLAAYLARYTTRPIGIAMGAGSLLELFNEDYYSNLDGGVLESLGRLFKNDLQLLIYPMLREDGGLHTVDNLKIAPPMDHLYEYLVAQKRIQQLTGYNTDLLHIFSPDVLDKIRVGDDTWRDCVPAAVAAVIEERGLFGHRSKPAAPSEVARLSAIN